MSASGPERGQAKRSRRSGGSAAAVRIAQPHLQRVTASASGDEPPGDRLRGDRPRRRVDAACSGESNRPEQRRPCRTWPCDVAKAIARRALAEGEGDRADRGSVRLEIGRLQNCDRRPRRAGADACFEGWALAAEWIGASDGAASGPRNPPRATPRRPALLIADSEARLPLN
jgi:hypothetical protein